MLDHRGEQLVQVAELLASLANLLFLVINRSLDVLVSLLSLFLLAPDLNGNNERQVVTRLISSFFENFNHSYMITGLTGHLGLILI